MIIEKASFYIDENTTQFLFTQMIICLNENKNHAPRIEYGRMSNSDSIVLVI